VERTQSELGCKVALKGIPVKCRDIRVGQKNAWIKGGRSTFSVEKAGGCQFQNGTTWTVIGEKTPECKLCSGVGETEGKVVESTEES